MDIVNDLLDCELEELGGALMTNSVAKAAFRSLAELIKETCELIGKQKGMARRLCKFVVQTVIRCHNLITVSSWRALFEL